MSATAFQRLRREAEAKKQAESNSQVNSDLTVKEIKVMLDEKGIEYKSNATKPELLKLLEGAE